MRYKFNIKLTENDYYEFNEFHGLRSKQGKQAILTLRVAIAVLFCIMALISLYGGGFSYGTLVVLLFVVIFELGLPSFFRRNIKANLKAMKKNGKMAFSPESIIEFYEDKLIEETDVNKTEQKYVSVEKVCVITGKFIYIYISSVQAYIIPAMAFKDAAEFDEFVEFIKTKSPIVEYYDK
ncbi:MAG: YcxB family protein [Clostridia bacterium]|nr:YcxB family protein [Clostridia bacterium]